MREITVDPSGIGKRLDRFLHGAVPGLPTALAQKCLRLKRIKVNGKAAKPDARLCAGDVVTLFIEEEYFAQQARADALLGSFRHHLRIVYEDAQVLLIDKKPGLIVHPDEAEKVNTLVTHVRAYLYQRGAYDSMAEGAFAPTPVNRIDRFTGGIVLFAKTREALDVLNRAIRDGEVHKYYLCAVHGALNRADGLLDDYLLKNETQKRVTVLRHDAPGAQRAQTAYRTLARGDGLSLLECRLLTGRTHQIRAQLAAAGHPLLGDNQYGDAKRDAQYDRTYQALYAYRVEFYFEGEAGALAPLNGRTFQVGSVPFAASYFPGVRY